MSFSTENLTIFLSHIINPTKVEPYIINNIETELTYVEKFNNQIDNNTLTLKNFLEDEGSFLLNKHISELSLLIETDKEKALDEVSELFSVLNAIREQDEELLKETLLILKPPFTDSEVKQLFTAMDNSLNREQAEIVNFVDFMAKRPKNYNRELLEKDFMSIFYGDWEQVKSLKRAKKDFMNDHYATFLAFITDEYLPSIAMEIKSDLKNYVLSGYAFNDFFKLTPNKNPESKEAGLIALREIFDKYSQNPSFENKEALKKLFNQRMNDTLSFVHGKTSTTNDLSSLTVSILKAGSTELENCQLNSINKYKDGTEKRMPAELLDRVRFDIDNPNVVHVDDIKSLSIGEMGNSLLKTYAIANLLNKENGLTVNYYLDTPTTFTDTEQKTKHVIDQSTDNEERDAINYLTLLTTILNSVKEFPLTEQNLNIRKDSLGFNYEKGLSTKLSNVNELLFDKDIIKHIFTLLTKNIANINNANYTLIANNLSKLLDSFLNNICDEKTMKTVFNDSFNHLSHSFKEQLLANNKYSTELENTLKIIKRTDLSDIALDNFADRTRSQNYFNVEREQKQVKNAFLEIKNIIHKDSLSLIQQMGAFVRDYHKKASYGATWITTSNQKFAEIVAKNNVNYNDNDYQFTYNFLNNKPFKMTAGLDPAIYFAAQQLKKGNTDLTEVIQAFIKVLEKSPETISQEYRNLAGRNLHVYPLETESSKQFLATMKDSFIKQLNPITFDTLNIEQKNKIAPYLETIEKILLTSKEPSKAMVSMTELEKSLLSSYLEDKNPVLAQRVKDYFVNENPYKEKELLQTEQLTLGF